MPIIDLGFDPEDQQQPTEPQKGNIIDLGTGEAMDAGQAHTPNDFVLGDAGKEELLGLTPEEAAELPEMGYLENKLLFSGEVGKSFRLAMGALVSSDPAQQIEIIQNVLPDAEVKTFESGETVIKYGGERFVLNKPGVSATDVTRFAGQFLASLPVGKMSQLGR